MENKKNKIVSPCIKCKYRGLMHVGECNNGFGICQEYMNYQQALRENREMQEVARLDAAYGEYLND